MIDFLDLKQCGPVTYAALSENPAARAAPSL